MSLQIFFKVGNLDFIISNKFSVLDGISRNSIFHIVCRYLLKSCHFLLKKRKENSYLFFLSERKQEIQLEFFYIVW